MAIRDRYPRTGTTPESFPARRIRVSAAAAAVSYLTEAEADLLYDALGAATAAQLAAQSFARQMAFFLSR